MARNKSYGLTGDLMKLKSCDKNKKQSKGKKGGDIEPIYLNATQIKREGKLDTAEEDYDILQNVENDEDTSVETDISKRKVNQKNENRLVRALLRMVVVLFVLFCAVAGICVWLAITISKEQTTSHFHKDLHHSWEPWAPWSLCSVTCDFGISLRKRNCSNGDSKTGVTDCVGDASEYRLCNEALCNAVNGEWSAWSTWESCSTTCGTGLQLRQRNCSHPRPSNGGAHCFGESTDYRSCHLTYCSVRDGYWSSWSSWSNCSSTCTKTRTRNCTTFTGGRQCLGNSVDLENCNSAGCALFAQYDCREAQKTGIHMNGVYVIFLQKSKQKIRVYCDMTTDGGGWTVFQNRFNGSVDFYRSFAEYTNGFGTHQGEFWLGLKYIQELTDPADGASELRLDLSAADNSTAYEVYQNFYLSGGYNYTLNIDKATGTAGDSQGLSYHNRQGFSTYDRDVSGRNCSVNDHGGWWYTNCAYANLNGEYATPGTKSSYHSGEGGMTYRNFKNVESLRTSKMMFRRAGE